MKRRLLLIQKQSPGDILVFTGAIRDLKLTYSEYDISIDTICPAIFENNPYLSDGDPAIKQESFTIDYDEIHNSGWSGMHFSTGFHIGVEKALGVQFEQTSLLPDLHLNDDEKKWVNQVEQLTGYSGKFWIINAGHKKDFPLKQWGIENWQELIDILKNKIQFVQVGERHPNHIHPILKNVINLVGKTDTRQLIRLSYHAQGAVCAVTLQMHLMAAFQKPCAVIAGGREPRRWEMYPHHRYIDTMGQLSCCAYDGCWMSGKIHYDEPGQPNKQCKNIVGWNGDINNQRQKCMALITPEHVSKEILNYYEGGMLQW